MGGEKKSPSEIIHGHLIVLVRHKQAQTCLQSDQKHYERISTKFKKKFFLIFLLPYSLSQSLTDVFSQASSVAEN